MVFVLPSVIRQRSGIRISILLKISNLQAFLNDRKVQISCLRSAVISTGIKMGLQVARSQVYITSSPETTHRRQAMVT